MSTPKIWATEVEPEAVKQIDNVSSLSFVWPYVAVMPDVHAGYGCTVGSVIPTYKVVIPGSVGVDIGCGMAAYLTNLTAKDLPDNLHQIRSDIEAVVPVGFNIRNNVHSLHNQLDVNNFHSDIQYSQKHFKQLGTLGGGNHFIELCLDENQNVWVMLHSGSRGIGNVIGSYFIEKAKLDMEKWCINLPDKELAYIPMGSEHFQPYLEHVSWAQNWAYLNRQVMLSEVFDVLKKHFPDVQLVKEAINCHHNYVELENHFGKNVYVARKGAIRARKGDLGIIPGSMGTKSYIVIGKGNPESFNSCSHGAGRIMSRTAAKAKFTLEDHIKATEGVECKKDLSVIDETPLAYKDIDTVMENQRDLVDIVHTLKQVLCIKG